MHTHAHTYIIVDRKLQLGMKSLTQTEALCIIVKTDQRLMFSAALCHIRAGLLKRNGGENGLVGYISASWGKMEVC